LKTLTSSTDGSAYILDFGQHFGAQLSAVPPSYIRWLITAGVHATRPDLMAALRKQGFLTDPVLKDSPPSSSSNGQQQSAAWTAPSIHATNDARFSDAHRQTPRWTSDTDLSRMDGEGNSFSQPHPAQTASLSSTDRPLLNSMFSLLSHPMSNAASPIATLGNESPRGASTLPNEGLIGQATATDLGAEVGEAIEEIIEELETADDQIAGYASDHIHSNEIILTYGPSVTVQKFLLKAASKRKFTVMHAESFPNNHESVHATVSGSLKGGAGDTGPDRFHRSLTAAGITVILIPDSAIFAVMSRVNKIIIGTHAVLANGGLVAAAGARMLAKAASMHKTPVVVLSGVYKLSPIYPFNTDAFIEYGDAGKVIPYEDGGLIDKVEVENPLHDYVPPELIDLYITNLWVPIPLRSTVVFANVDSSGAHAPSYLYTIVADHYRAEDTHLTQKEVY